MHVAVVEEHRRANIVAGEEATEFCADVFDGKTVGKEFADHFAVGNQIDERNEFAAHEMLENEAHEPRNGGFVAYDLRFLFLVSIHLP